MFTKNPIIQIISTGWHFAHKHRPLIPLYLILFVSAQSLRLTQPWLIGQLVNAVQHSVDSGAKNPDASLHNVYFYLALFLGAQVSFWIFHGPGRLIEQFVAFQIRANYKSHMFHVLTQLPLQWHRSHHSGDCIDKINRASLALFNFFESTFQSIYMLLRLLGGGTILLFFMPSVGTVAVVTASIAFTLIYLFDRVLFGKYKYINNCENAVASALHDYVTNIISIITLRLESRVINEVKRRISVSFPTFKLANVLNESKWCLTSILIALMTFAAMTYYAHSTVIAGKVLLAGTFFTLFEYLRGIGESFYDFASVYGTVVRRAADVMSAKPLLENYVDKDDEGRDHSLPKDWKQLQLRDLNFVYKDEKQRTHHLDHVSIELRRNWKIAFVGESGSGKSTLLNLLRGTLVTDDVRLVCDGVKLPHGLSHLAACTTLMPQSPEIFADTLRFNITFGIESEEVELMRAVELARFDNVLARLPEGLDTNIAEKGVNLSGGESQRLALARGIFFARESDIVLLDEPTSSVDSENERLIYRNILDAFADKCVISSVHKLHLLDMFDMIYVFSNGALVEHGTLQELLAKSGSLASLWKHAASNNSASQNGVVDALHTAATESLAPV